MTDATGKMSSLTSLYVPTQPEKTQLNLALGCGVLMEHARDHHSHHHDFHQTSITPLFEERANPHGVFAPEEPREVVQSVIASRQAWEPSLDETVASSSHAFSKLSIAVTPLGTIPEASTPTAEAQASAPEQASGKKSLPLFLGLFGAKEGSAVVSSRQGR